MIYTNIYPPEGFGHPERSELNFGEPTRGERHLSDG
jgi:hypothetical protein